MLLSRRATLEVYDNSAVRTSRPLLQLKSLLGNGKAIVPRVQACQSFDQYSAISFTTKSNLSSFDITTS
jgi:hypothetical protein